MPKSPDQSVTRRLLMEAAVLELAEKGWGALRTREVADRAGVNKALVHYHFGSMANLRHEAVAMLMSQVVDETGIGLVDGPTLAEGLRRFGKSIADFRFDDPRGVVLMEAMLHVPRDERLGEILLQALNTYEDSLRRRIEADVAAGLLDEKTDPRGLASVLTALLDGLALHAYMRPNMDLGRATEALAVVVESSVTPTSGRGTHGREDTSGEEYTEKEGEVDADNT